MLWYFIGLKKSILYLPQEIRGKCLALEFVRIIKLKGFSFKQLRHLYLEVLGNVSFLKFIRRRQRRKKKRFLVSKLFWGLARRRKKR